MQLEQASITRPLDDITLYPIEPDPVLAEEVRRKVGRELRAGMWLWGLLGSTYCLIMMFDQPGNLRPVWHLILCVCMTVLCFIGLRSLQKKVAQRLISVGKKSIIDRISIWSKTDRVIRYRYSCMRCCTVLPESLTIEMHNGPALSMPVQVFASSYEMKAFAKALAEQKNVPVIDLTVREVAGVS